MTKDPLISVVLPTFNGARYLSQSIESVIAQTYGEWELIIVDDASTDETPDIISKYVNGDDRIRSIRHKANYKLPGSLNSGFADSRGDFLTWTSDDNLYHPEAFEIMIQSLVQSPDVDLVYTDYRIIDEHGNEVGERRVKPPEYLVFGCIVGPSFMYRRDVYEVIGDYDEELFLAEDYDYWLRTFNQFRLNPLHRNLYWYRKHQESLAGTYRSGISISTLEVKRRNILPLNSISYSLKAAALMHMFSAARRNGLCVDSYKYLGKAILLSPLVVTKFMASYFARLIK